MRSNGSTPLTILLLILAIAYLLLCGLGLLAKGCLVPGDWCSNSKQGTCSLFVIGQLMIHKMSCSPHHAFRAFLQATEDAVPKWG